MASLQLEDYQGMGCISCGTQLQLCGFMEVIQLRQEEREFIFDVRRHALLDEIFPCVDW